MNGIDALKALERAAAEEMNALANLPEFNVAFVVRKIIRAALAQSAPQEACPLPSKDYIPPAPQAEPRDPHHGSRK